MKEVFYSLLALINLGAFWYVARIYKPKRPRPGK